MRIVTPFASRRRDRHLLAHPGAALLRDDRPAVHRREPAGRGLHARDRVRRQVAARRLHAADDLGVVLVQPRPVSEAALRPGQGFRARLAGRAGAARDRRDPVAAGEGPAGIREARALAARARCSTRRPGAGSAMHLAGALFGIVTKTQLTHVPYKGGGATTTAVMGGEATTAFNTLETVIALITRRQAAAAGGVHARACAGAARRADRDGGRGQGLRSDRLVRPDGAGGHAARDRRAGERRNREGDGDAGDPQAARWSRARRRSAARRREFDRFVRDEIAKWTSIIQQAGIKLE